MEDRKDAGAKNNDMDLTELFYKGYEIMGMTSTKDDAYDLAEEYMKNPFYISYVIAPYKQSAGKEDAYAVLILSKKFNWI